MRVGGGFVEAMIGLCLGSIHLPQYTYSTWVRGV